MGRLVAVILTYSCCEFNLHLQRICPMVGGKRKDRDKKIYIWNGWRKDVPLSTWCHFTTPYRPLSLPRVSMFVLVGITIKASQFASRELFKLNGQIRQLCPQIQLTCWNCFVYPMQTFKSQIKQLHQALRACVLAGGKGGYSDREHPVSFSKDACHMHWYTFLLCYTNLSDYK